jgi:ubiquinone/menaquinone biosynthesis C-methylase UbiE
VGKLGGVIMARTNADFGTWISNLLEVAPNDCVLEVGFGPGVIIQCLSELATAGHVAGVDSSREMVEQARARNVAAIRSGRVDLRHGSVESLPFDDNRFDKALAINSMQVWPDAVVGLREMRRVMKPGGRIAIGFTRHSRMPNKGLMDTLNAAGFTKPHVVEASDGFCALAVKL